MVKDNFDEESIKKVTNKRDNWFEAGINQL